MRHDHLVGPEDFHRIRLPLLIGEFHEPRVFPFPVEVLHHRPDLPAREPSIWQILVKATGASSGIGLIRLWFSSNSRSSAADSPELIPRLLKWRHPQQIISSPAEMPELSRPPPRIYQASVCWSAHP